MLRKKIRYHRKSSTHGASQSFTCSLAFAANMPRGEKLRFHRLNELRRATLSFKPRRNYGHTHMLEYLFILVGL